MGHGEMGHGDRFLVPYLLFAKSTVWDKEPVPVSHLPVSHPDSLLFERNVL